MTDVFQGFDDSIVVMSQRIRETEDFIVKADSNCCKYVVDIANHIQALGNISTSIMNVADILDLKNSAEAVRLTCLCRYYIGKIHNMCKLAYLKDESAGYDKVLVSRELGCSLMEYFDTETKEGYVLGTGNNQLKVQITDDLEGLTIVPVNRRQSEWK